MKKRETYCMKKKKKSNTQKEKHYIEKSYYKDLCNETM